MPKPSSPAQSTVTKSRQAAEDRNENPPKRHEPANHHYGWADGLLKFLDDPSDPAVVYLDDEIIAVQDKFPKAKRHYLVMPRDTGFRSVKDVTRDDLGLLRRMEGVANKLVASDDNNNNGDPSLEYKYGFHAVPSMNHLHMHVISQDFDSNCLRNKKHWNSFTTPFFISVQDMMAGVEKGDVDSFRCRENRLKDGLKCHRCNRAQTNMPKLKEHIASCCSGRRVDS